MSKYQGKNQPVPEPKPFFFVTLKTPPQRSRLIFHDRFQDLSGRLELEIEVLSEYLYVGSGAIELDEGSGKAYYAFARSNGQIVIPGTGIKGAIRGIVEAISNSCVQQVARRETISKQHEKCDRIEQGQEMKVKLCPACSLFGTTGYRGRMHFTDAQLLNQVRPQVIKISDLWPPRQGKGRKFYQAKSFQPTDNQRPERNHRFVEAVPKSTRFSTTLFFENVRKAEIGLLIRGLGLDCNTEKQGAIICAFPVKMGGAKPRCLGAVCFRPKKVYAVPGAHEMLFQNLAWGGACQPLPETLMEWLKEESLLDQGAWKKFCLEAISQNEMCPKELY